MVKPIGKQTDFVKVAGIANSTYLGGLGLSDYKPPKEETRYCTLYYS